MKWYLVSPGLYCNKLALAALQEADRLGIPPLLPEHLRGKQQKRVTMIEKIISGGQTGVDRAALDVALELGIPCGGWCPKGRLAEDGRIPDRYSLVEMPTASYQDRTMKNVRESDATLILAVGDKLEGGTLLTKRCALELHKPVFVVYLDQTFPSIEISYLRAWFVQQNVKTLNVAGPRESKQPGIGHRAKGFLLALFNDWPSGVFTT